MPTVWGFVAEFGYQKAAFTLVCLAEGTTSLYFSNGGGIIGGGLHPAVAESSRSLLMAAEGSRDRMRPVDSYSLPESGTVKMYALTYSGTLCAEADEASLRARTHELWPLYYHCHEVIARLRELDEGRTPS